MISLFDRDLKLFYFSERLYLRSFHLDLQEYRSCSREIGSNSHTWNSYLFQVHCQVESTNPRISNV